MSPEKKYEYNFVAVLMNKPLISVVIPNYNYGRYLGTAIDSVLNQSYCPFEILVVDDGSTDHSDVVLAAYGDRIRWFKQQNQGVSVARNLGIQESRGEFVAFLDADDIWHPLKLERQMALMGNSTVGMVYCGRQIIDESGRELEVETSGLRGRILPEIALLQAPGVPASGSSPLIRKTCLDRIGLYDIGLSTSSDWDMHRRIACHYEIDIIREPLFSYRIHGSSMHHNVALFERDMLRAFEKMFKDPDAIEVHPLKRQCYSKLYLMLSGSHLHVSKWDKCFQYACKSLSLWPFNITYLSQLPLRRIQRLFTHWTGT